MKLKIDRLFKSYFFALIIILIIFIAPKESFCVKEGGVIIDPDRNEMIMVREKCCPVLRLHKHFKIKTVVTDICNGIVIMIENESRNVCIFADELVGEQQVVVKTLPQYIKKTKGISGCTLLGNGSVTLILDVQALTEF